MKEIVLVRHAKSSWKDLSCSDFERPLNKRGKHDAPRMGDRLRSAGHAPDCILSSPATRAATTANIIAEILDFEQERIAFIRELYLADVDVLLASVQSLDNQADSALLFAHNPGITEFANYLSGSEIENVPTCGTVHIRFAVTDWNEISRNSGELVLFDFPKNN